MAENPKHLRLVVAYPGDVLEERKLVDKVVAELNRTTAKDRGLWIEVGAWDVDAYPGFHVEGPQGICDAVLKINDADVVVAILWARLGDGTRHEIESSVKHWGDKGSPAPMVFFRDEPPPRLDGETLRQMADVADYKEQLEERKGLTWPRNGRTWI